MFEKERYEKCMKLTIVMWACLFASLILFFWFRTNEWYNDQCNVSVAVEAKNYSILGLGFASFHNHAEVRVADH